MKTFGVSILALIAAIAIASPLPAPADNWVIERKLVERERGKGLAPDTVVWGSKREAGKGAAPDTVVWGSKREAGKVSAPAPDTVIWGTKRELLEEREA